MADTQLINFSAEMRRYNARRRFRAGIMAAKAIRGMSHLSVKTHSSEESEGGSQSRTTIRGQGGGENVQVSHAAH